MRLVFGLATESQLTRVNEFGSTLLHFMLIMILCALIGVEIYGHSPSALLPGTSAAPAAVSAAVAASATSSFSFHSATIAFSGCFCYNFMKFSQFSIYSDTNTFFCSPPNLLCEQFLRLFSLVRSLAVARRFGTP